MVQHWPRSPPPRVANWLPKFDSTFSFSSALGPIQGGRVQHLLVTWGQIKNIFSILALIPNIKPLGLISTFALIGRLDLS